MSFFDPLREHPLSQRYMASMNRIGESLSESHLLHIDWRVISLTLICALLFALNVSFKTSGSSIKNWNGFIQGDSSKQTVIGSARFIRFDEWAMATPLTVSQTLHGFETTNPSLGAEKSAMLMSLPVKTFPSILRPQLLSYFIFDTETAYSFTWNYKVYGMFLGVFFFLLLLTRNNFWLSVSGSLWLCYSAFVQWWYSTPEPEMIMSVSLVLLFFVYLCYSQKTILIILSALGLALYSVTFLLFFYPPHQIPLAYMMLFVLIAYMMTNHSTALMKKQIVLKAVGLVGVLLLLGMSLQSFMQQAAGTIAIMTQTEYPGNRISTGGEISLLRYFGGFLDFYFSEFHYPQAWDNVCEASNFVLLYPVVIIAMIRSRIKGIAIDKMELMLLVYIVFMSVWMLIGYPEIFAKLTLLDRVKENRAFIGIGYASIVLVIVYLSRGVESAAVLPSETVKSDDASKKKKKNTKAARSTSSGLSLASLKLDTQSIAMSAGIFVLLFVYGQMVNGSVANFFSVAQLIFAALFFAVLSLFVLVRQRTIFATLLLCLVVYSNFMVNPITFGLTPLLEKNFMHALTDIRSKDPDAKWVFYGSNIVANYHIAAGTNIINGTKFAPDLEMMKMLDPEGKNKKTYNRFAQIRYMPNDKAVNVNDVRFELDNYDGYSVFVNPAAEQLKKVGVKYFAMAMLPAHADLQELEPMFLDPFGTIWLYKRREHAVSETQAPLRSLTKIEDPMRFRAGDFSINTNEKKTAFVLKGAGFDAGAKDLAGGLYVDVDGHLFEATYGLDYAKVPDPKFHKSAFQAEIPFAHLGKGKVEFRLVFLTKDKKSYCMCADKLSAEVN